MIFIGTTGWLFEFWDDTFYPPQFEGERLSYFSGVSGFTEIRSSFQQLPKEERVHRWYSQTPEDFIFVSRMSKKVTFNPKLEVIEEDIKQYFDAFKPLDSKHQMVLLHFPMKFQKGPQSVEFLVNILEGIHSQFNGNILVEAPNRSWQKPDIKELLHERSACLVGNDRRPIPSLMRDPEVYYLRLLGDRRTVPKSSFGKQALDRNDDIKFWAQHLKFVDKSTKIVFVTVDNHFSGSATDDAYLMADWFEKLNVKYKGFAKLPEQQVKPST